MEEQKSSMLIFALSLALALFLYMYFGNRIEKRKTHVANATSVSKSEEEKKVAFAGRDVKVETAKYIAVINTQGGVLRSLRLKDYKDDGGRPMELVPEGGFFWNTLGEKVSLELNRALFDPEVRRTKDRVQVVLRAHLANATFEKTYTFYENEYRVGLSTSGGMGVYFGPKVAPSDRKARYSFVGPLVFDGKKVREVKLKKEPQRVFDSPVWVALQSLYFTVTLVPEVPVKAKVVKESKGNYYIYLYPKKGGVEAFWGIAGPKKYELLKSYGLHLEENIRFGIFGIFSKPMLYLMNWLYGIIPNYGVAIIILTVIIKIIFHPLTVRGYKSMNKMKELQPLIQQIREAYKDDPNKMNQ